MEDFIIEKVKKLRVKKDDIVLIILPHDFYDTPKKAKTAKRFTEGFEKILPYNNKVVIIPNNADIKIIEKDDQKLLGEEWGMYE